MFRRELILAAVGLFLGVTALTIWLSPRVSEVNIQQDGHTPWLPIQIRFNQPIDPNSIEERFSITPAIDGDLLVEGNELSFIPHDAMDYGTEFKVELLSGIQAKNRLPLWRSHEWHFTIAEPKLVYLKQENEVTNIWQETGGGESIQLTDETLGVWDYSIVPQGGGILYSAQAPDGTMDLFLWRANKEIELVLDCLDSLCRAAEWQPRGQLIAFERRFLDRASEPAQVWILDLNSGQQMPVHDPEILNEIDLDSFSSHSPRWSADGRYLAYYHSAGRLLIVMDMLGGKPALIPSNLELMGNWSPVQYLMSYIELTFGSETPEEHEAENHETHRGNSSLPLVNHLIVADPVAESVRDLSQGQESDDGLPAWHPKGSQLALSKSISGAGKQMWVVTVDGQEANALTDEPLVNFSAPSWSPDGRYLAYMRFELSDSAGLPSVWLHDFSNNQKLLVEEGAFLPGWLE